MEPTEPTVFSDGVPKPGSHDRLSIGERLRWCRRSRHWSLLDVQARTAGEFKASALGAYERGERALTIDRLTRLTEVYSVTVPELFGAEPAIDLPTLHAEEEWTDRLGDDFVLGALVRFATYVRVLRGEATRRGCPSAPPTPNSLLLGREQDEIEQRLARLGLVPEQGDETTALSVSLIGRGAKRCCARA
jgi:transcriptional regulator with XRE-family HTH domain